MTLSVLQLIRDEIRAGTTDKDIYKKLQDDFGESVLYTPKFDLVTAALWLSPVSFRGSFYNSPPPPPPPNTHQKKDTRKMFWYFNIWVLDQLLFAGAAGGIWAYNKRKQSNNVHVMALNLVRGVALSPKEKQTMLDLLTPPPPERSTLSSWLKKRLGQ